MKIQLPLENWADLLPFVLHRQLVHLLFNLDDRQFASILQYCLNEFGHITLGYLRILAPNENGPVVEVTKMLGWFSLLETPMPDEPIPKNVHNFKALTFRYFDSSVLNFLQKFHQHQNALLANVNLSIRPFQPMGMEKPILAQILPLLGENINSIKLANPDLLGYSRLLHNIQCRGYNEEEFSELVTKMLAQTRILSVRHDLNFFHYAQQLDWYCRWLHVPRMDGRPRMFITTLTNGQALNFIDLIKKKFLMAKHPVAFFVLVRMGTDPYLVEDICLENVETNENLRVVKKYYRVFLINRYPMAMAVNGTRWIQANQQEIMEFETVSHNRTIYLDNE